MNNKFKHIVIGGQQRSGTSLVRAIIGSHSRFSIFQWDLTFWPKFSEIYAGRHLSLTQKRQLIFDVLNHEKVKQTDVKFEILDFNTILNNPTSSEDFFYTFYTHFLTLYLQKTNGDICGIKTPENEFYSIKILTEFPLTKFIHVVRNPLDVAVSLKEAKTKWWGGKINYNSHIRLWNKSAEIAKENLKRYPNNYFVIKYEDIIEKPVDSVKQICSFLEIQFEKEMLEMKGQPGWKGSNSSFKKKAEESNFKSNSINRFKEQLPERIQHLYFHFLQENLKYFGYTHKEILFSSRRILNFKINNLSESFKENVTRLLRRSFLYLTVKKLVSNK